MEKFFVDDRPFSTMEDFIEYMGNLDRDEIESTPDTIVRLDLTKPEPFMKFDLDFIKEAIYDSCEERMSEDADEVDKLEKILQKHINFEAINAEMPILYYTDGRYEEITHREILKLMD